MKISVGIPFYNADMYLSDAIKSVLKQSYENWELILVNDGSKDNSLDIANRYAELDSRIRVINDDQNKKLPARLNQLVLESSGFYVARMDADDIMHSERLERQVKFLEENQNYDLVSTGLLSIDNNNNVKGFRGVDCLYDDFSRINLSYPITHPSVMARKSWYERNCYSEEFPRAEDFELWTRAIANNDFKMAVLPDLLLFYREEGNLNIEKIVKSYKDILKIHDKYNLDTNFNINKMKTKFKLLIVNVLYYSGNLQKLASHRNLSFISEKEQIDFQLMLNNIIDIG